MRSSFYPRETIYSSLDISSRLWAWSERFSIFWNSRLERLSQSLFNCRCLTASRCFWIILRYIHGTLWIRSGSSNRRCSIKEVLKTFQNSQKNTCTRVPSWKLVGVSKIAHLFVKIWLPSSILLCSSPYLLSVCPINLPVSLCGNFSISKANLFMELQQSAIPGMKVYDKN